MLKANLIMGVANKALGAAFGFVRDSVIGATAETERFRVVIGSLIGDQEKANQVIHDLDYSPVSDFYGTAAAIGGLRTFATMGMDIDKAKTQMELLGDVAQGNSEAFNSLSANMAQVYSKGKADAMDLKQFMAQGFDVTGVLGLTEAQKKAGVTYDQVEEALRRVTAAGGPYHNMLQKQMNTLGGLIKQYASFKAATAEAIGTGINEELKDLLKYILQIAKAGQDAFVGKFVKFLKEVIHWIFQVIIMWEVLGYRLEDMGDALAPVKKFFLDLKDAAGDVLTGIMILAVELGRLFIAAFKPIQAFVSPIIRELGAIAKDVFTAIANFIHPLVPMVSESAGFFGVLGKAISGILRPALILMATVKGITTAIAIGKGIVAGIKAVQTAYALLTGTMSVMKAAAEGNRLAMLMLDAQMLKSKITTIAHTAATKIASLATKVWSGIQAIFNAIMSANPIALIILGVIALIAAIVLLVKNWDKVGPAIMKALSAIGNFFKMIGSAIVGFFKWVWNAIVGVFQKIINFVKANLINIINVIVTILFPIAGIIMALVRLIIKHWDVIGPKVKAIWEKIKTFFVGLAKKIADIFKALVETIRQAFQWVVDRAIAIWDTLKGWFGSFIEAIKGIWLSITGWFAGLWSGIVNNAMSVWEGLKSWFAGLVQGIKDIWNGITGFFSGLWEAMKQGPTAAIEYIKNAFLGLFTTLQEKLFGFINKIKDAWNGIKNFFGGIAEGVSNFVTGGNNQLQPAYAGTSQAAVADRVGPTSNYAAYNSTGGNSTVNATTSINVNVPPGTPQAQSEAIARQIDAQFNERLSSTINSSRSNIPSPEVRRR